MPRQLVDVVEYLDMVDEIDTLLRDLHDSSILVDKVTFDILNLLKSMDSRFEQPLNI